MLAKAEQFAPDVLLPDLEDSVPDAEKAAARACVADWLPRYIALGPRIMPRVNSLSSGLLEADLAAVVQPGIWGISIGKIDSPGDISAISQRLAARERVLGLALGSLRLIPWIETAKAIVHCHAICMASPRIAAVAFGGEDYTNDMGIERLDDEAQLVYARSALCTAARAADVAALDTPYFRFRDEDGLRASCTAARQLGFRGRFAIHPAQLTPINECFSPGPAEIEAARRIVDAFEEAESRGRGSTSLDGRVIDVPVVKRARAVLELASSLAGPGSETDEGSSNGTAPAD
jgi:citrate lyase subunit beta/citryl-CoA lyase